MKKTLINKEYLSVFIVLSFFVGCKKEVDQNLSEKEISNTKDTTEYQLPVTSSICLKSGGTIRLNAFKTGVNTYRWLDNNDSLAVRQVLEAGTYRAERTIVKQAVSEITISSCLKDTVEVKGVKNAAVTGCVDAQTTAYLNTNEIPGQGLDIFWSSTSSQKPAIYVTSPGQYTCTILDSANMFSWSYIFLIQTCPSKTDTINLSPGISANCVSLKKQLLLSASALSIPGYKTSYKWSNNATSKDLLVATKGLYSVTVSSLFTDTVSATVTNCEDLSENITVPSVFTPNSDGYNDNWKVEGTNLKEINAEVRDNNANLVFASSGPRIIWDGTFNGTQIPAGAYFYKINYLTLTGLSKTLNGQVQLVR